MRPRLGDVYVPVYCAPRSLLSLSTYQLAEQQILLNHFTPVAATLVGLQLECDTEGNLVPLPAVFV